MTSTPDLCDRFPDEVRIAGRPFTSYGGRAAFEGEVVTVRCIADGIPDNTLLKELAATAGDGRVIVVDVEGMTTHAVLGDLIAQDAADHGWAGIVIDGAVRDVDVLRTIAIGVRARGSVPLRSVRRGVGDRDVSVDLDGATVTSGDHLYADATGIVVASRALV
jgi:regulator of ribonuclease activity A